MLNGFWPAGDRFLNYSNLPIELLGVVVNSSLAARSSCLIRLSPAATKASLFRPGEKAFEIAEIVKIGGDGVIIKNLVSNTLEYLTFWEKMPFPSHQPQAPSLPRVRLKSSGKITVDISAEVLRHYSNNIGEILDSAYAAPRYRNEKDGRKSIEGFEISRIKKDGIVDYLGFRDGDILVEVNGEALDSLEKVLKFISQIQNWPQAELIVLRGTHQLKIVFQRK